MYPKEYRYTETHEWIRVDGQTGTVGITRHAADQLGDVTYVEPPQLDATVKQGDEAGAVESIKAASDIYAPVSGRIAAVNDALADAPELVNNDPHGDGWFFQIKLSNAAELSNLMDAETYEVFLAKEGK